jgi:hypothetical protein
LLALPPQCAGRRWAVHAGIGTGLGARVACAMGLGSFRMEKWLSALDDSICVACGLCIVVRCCARWRRRRLRLRRRTSMRMNELCSCCAARIFLEGLPTGRPMST